MAATRRTRTDRLRIYALKDEVFQADAFLVVGPVDRFQAFVRRRYNEDDFEVANTSAWGRVLIHKWSGGGREWLVHFPTLRPHPTTILHESVHLALDMLGHRGSSDVETICYYSESVFRQITAKLARWRQR